MYNRYIPQPDGSYRKNRIDTPPPCPPEPPPVMPAQDQPCYPPPPPKPLPPPSRQNTCASDFLRQLLPKNMDTGDLLILVLLLLIAGDCQEDRNTALLTLILYFFL